MSGLIITKIECTDGTRVFELFVDERGHVVDALRNGERRTPQDAPDAEDDDLKITIQVRQPKPRKEAPAATGEQYQRVQAAPLAAAGCVWCNGKRVC
jgi:hypothetical protein